MWSCLCKDLVVFSEMNVYIKASIACSAFELQCNSFGLLQIVVVVASLLNEFVEIIISHLHFSQMPDCMVGVHSVSLRILLAHYLQFPF